MKKYIKTAGALIGMAAGFTGLTILGLLALGIDVCTFEKVIVVFLSLDAAGLILFLGRMENSRN